jgi:poly-beta-1,6-N-acetyl-D-glucosamine synthase
MIFSPSIKNWYETMNNTLGNTLTLIDQPAFAPSLIEFTVLLLVAYPFVTCLLWSSSGLCYAFNCAIRAKKPQPIFEIPSYCVVIPFHAEPEAALNTMRSLLSVTPAPVEIIIIDDGSPNPIQHAITLPDNVRIVRLAKNQGKAGALQCVLPTITTEILVCLDADTQSESRDWLPMLVAFSDPNLGAVTGKIRPVEGGGLVEWFQALDYLTVIAVIKAAESSWGGLLTVSGAFTAYRLNALKSIGGWNTKSSTEDIDASWRLQAHGWRLAFEKEWVARVEMAPSLQALWRQRRRWSTGLGRALRDYGVSSTFNGSKNLPILVMTLASLVWITALLVFGVTSIWVWFNNEQHISWPEAYIWASFSIAGVIAFYGQLTTAMAIDGRRPRTHWRSTIIVPFYPIYFWGVLFSSFLMGFPKGFLRLDDGKWQRTQRRSEMSIPT